MPIDPNILVPASVVIPLTTGLDLKTDVEALDPPALQLLNNAQFFTPGGIAKDFGYETVSVATLPNSAALGAPIRRFIDANTSQLIVDKDGILERAEGANRFHKLPGLNPFASGGCDRVDDLSTPGLLPAPDFDYATVTFVSAYELIIMRTSGNVISGVIREQSTGSVLYTIADTGSAAGSLKAIAVGNRLLAFWVNGTNIRGLTWDASAPTSAPTIVTNVVTTLNSTALDAVGGASVVYLAFSTASGAIMGRFNASSLALIGSLTGAAVTVTGPMGICLDASENSLVVFRDAGGVKMFGATSAGALRSTSTVDAAATTATQVACVSNENATTRGTVFYVNNTGDCVRAQVAFDGSGGAIASSTLFNVLLSHRPILISNTIFVGYFYTKINSASTERVLMTVAHDSANGTTATAEPVCWYLYGRATSAVSPSCVHITSQAGPGPVGLEYKWAAIVADRINTSTDFDQAIVVCKFRPWEGQALAAPSRSTTYVCNAFVSSGLGLLEASFGYAPSITSIAFSATGSLVVGQAYTWQAVYELTLPDGTVVRSPASLPVTSVVTAGNGTATLTITAPFSRSGLAVQTRVFRTPAGPGLSRNLLTAFSTTTRRTSDTLTIGDTASDTAIASNRLIYTSGDVLDAFPAPLSRAVTLHQNRLFAIEEFSREVRFTREAVDGESPAWHPNLAVDCMGQGLDPRALITSANGLWVLGRNRQTGAGAIALLIGQGPDDRGLGSSYTLQRIETADTGPTDWRQAIITPAGIIYEDPWQGFHLLPPGGGTPMFIGAAVETARVPATSAGSSTAMTLQIKRKEVRIAQVDRLFVWHYDVNAWSQRFLAGGAQPVDLCVWGGDSTLTVSGSTTILKQVTGNSPGFTDSGAQFYALKWKTAPIKTAGFAGFSRIWDIQLHGHATARHGVTVNLYFDDNPTPQVFTFSAADIDVKLASTDKYVLRLKPRVQKCTSFVVEVLDTDAGSGTRQGPTWNAIRVNYGAFRRPSKVRANLQKG